MDRLQHNLRALRVFTYPEYVLVCPALGVINRKYHRASWDVARLVEASMGILFWLPPIEPLR